MHITKVEINRTIYSFAGGQIEKCSINVWWEIRGKECCNSWLSSAFPNTYENKNGNSRCLFQFRTEKYEK